ncbi:SDR family oxidoreductase [soil metagenome]
MSGAVVVGGTAGLGLEVARHYHAAGLPVVLTGRDQAKAEAAAGALGEGATGLGVGPVSRLVLAAIARDANPVRQYDIAAATYLTTMKLVGYTATINTLLPQLSAESAVLLFGGRAKDRPYPGSTTVTTVYGGISSLIRALAIELAPIRFNAIHPGIVGDSPFWSQKPLEAVIARTPTGRLTTMADVVDASVFLLENRSINGVNLYVDGGWMLM